MSAKCEDHCRNQVRGLILTCHYFPSHIFFFYFNLLLCKIKKNIICINYTKEFRGWLNERPGMKSLSTQKSETIHTALVSHYHHTEFLSQALYFFFYSLYCMPCGNPGPEATNVCKRRVCDPVKESIKAGGGFNVFFDVSNSKFYR